LNCDSLRCFVSQCACDVCMSLHNQLALRRLRHASADGVFGITSPLAGRIVKDRQRLKPHNTARRASCRAIQAR